MSVSPATWEAETRESQVQGWLRLQHEFEARLGTLVRLCLNIRSKKGLELHLGGEHLSSMRETLYSTSAITKEKERGPSPPSVPEFPAQGLKN